MSKPRGSLRGVVCSPGQNKEIKMSISHRRSASHANVAIAKLPLWIMIGLAFSAAPVATFAANRNCTLIVPNNPLTPQGLATPYQLVATNLADGPCNEINKEDSSAFVQA